MRVKIDSILDPVTIYWYGRLAENLERQTLELTGRRTNLSPPIPGILVWICQTVKWLQASTHPQPDH